jgi:Ran GTPase-activating protein (RanGAP) involved in mRNA processing and transport
MIASNQNLQKLELNALYGLNSDAIISTAEAAEEHRSLKKLAIVQIEFDYYAMKAIGTMLPNAPKLRELILISCDSGQWRCRKLFSWLENKESAVEVLNLSGNRLNASALKEIGKMLPNVPNLRELILAHCSIRVAGIHQLVNGLANEKCAVEVLDLSCNSLGDKGTIILFQGLEANRKLKKLWLSWNDIGDDGARAIARVLENNITLQELALWGNRIGPFGAVTIADTLETNLSIKKLSLDNQIGNYSMGEQFMSRVDRLLALNRGGRQLLMELEESVLPLNFWPTVLARSSENADVIFFFLCEKHDVLLVNSGTKELIAHLFSSLPFHD